MDVLTVPNWSIGRERSVVRVVRDQLDDSGLDVHFCEADIDHNRTVTAFSGPHDLVQRTLFTIARTILPSIDLQRHIGVHPRIGGLDVCPFVPLSPRDTLDAEQLRAWIEDVAAQFADEFQVPVFLYEHSEKGRHSALLPILRRGGFGSLLDQELQPDYGPTRVHLHLGATVMGWRDPLVALNLNFSSENVDAAKSVAAFVRDQRRSGNPVFRGVRALGLQLPAQRLVQVSMNVTRPDETPLDPIIDAVETEAKRYRLNDPTVELIGVIRDVDLEHAVRVPFEPHQVVVTRGRDEPLVGLGD